MHGCRSENLCSRSRLRKRIDLNPLALLWMLVLGAWMLFVRYQGVSSLFSVASASSCKKSLYLSLSVGGCLRLWGPPFWPFGTNTQILLANPRPLTHPKSE